MNKGVVVSDIHAGSIYGLLPPGFITFEGVEKKLNVGQQYLWECWQDFCERVKEFKPDFVIANGDLIDGPQKKNHGSELSLITPGDQSKAATQTLQYLRKATGSACKWYFTQGTPYHTGAYGDAEEDIAHKCSAEKYPSVGTGKYCREVLTLEVDGGLMVEAAHHISTASVYKTTPLEKESQATWMANVTHETPRIDLAIRSHVHHYRNVEHGTGKILTTPCWQLQTRYARKNSVSRLLPDIGGVFFVLDYQAKKAGGEWCRLWPEKYILPPVQVAKL
jgi:hypothetical protein